MVSLLFIISRLVDFYILLILFYCLMSWFPMRQGGFMSDLSAAIASIVEPYLNFFRKILPPMGGIDFSPILAILVLQMLERFLLF